MEKIPVLVFGCGFLGQEVGAQLRRDGLPLMLVGDNYSEVGAARAKDFTANVVDITNDEALRAVGIGNGVRLIFCLFPEESKNVFLTIAARALDPNLEIVCITESTDAGGKLRAAGASRVIDPYKMTALKIHELIHRPWLVETLEGTLFGEANLDLAEVEVPKGAHLVGAPLHLLDLRSQFNLILLGVVDPRQGKELVFNSSRNAHRVQVGDVLVVIGLRDDIGRLIKALDDQVL
jgi:voltage-gated potassium channel